MPNISERDLKQLRSSVSELAVLNTIANAINLSMSVEEITQVIVDTCCSRTGATQGAVFLLPPDSNETENMQTFVRQSSDARTGLPFHLTESLIGWTLRHRKILTVNDTTKYREGEPKGLAAAGIENLLSAPLLSRARVIGTIVLINKAGAAGFSEDDKRFLGIVGASTAKVIENAQLFEKERKLTLLEEEMRTAARIQRGLLPAEDLNMESSTVVGFNRPARTVGGDFYDAFLLPDGKAFIMLGDIAGKGVPAALLAAKAQATMRALLAHSPGLPLSEMLHTTNEQFCRYTQPGEYLTAFVATYDPATGNLEYANCGHCPPFHVHADGRVTAVSGGNLIVGALPAVTFSTETMQLDSGEMIVVFTDGISECDSHSGEQYGYDRLNQILSAQAGRSAAVMRDAIVGDVDKFRAGAQQSDDVTLLILERR